MKLEDPDSDTLNQWHNDPENWIWGFIYYNPRDKRIFVLKRIKETGLTLNFAHPEAHLFLGLIILMIVLLAKFAT